MSEKMKVETREQLLEEIEEMRNKLRELEICSAEFQEARRRYEKLLESAPDALVFINREGHIVLLNAQLEELFGYRAEELMGRHIETLIPERFRTRHREHITKYFANPRVRPMGTGLSIYGRKRDGTEFPADISLSPLQTDSELLTTAAVRDISERKRAEEQIERNYHIQRVISSVLKISLEPVSLDEQLERVLELIFTIPGLSLQARGAIFLVEEISGKLVLRAPRSPKESQVMPCEEVPFGACLCGQAAADCRLVFADCLDERHEIRYGGEFPHGHYCVPIVSGEKALGLINVYVKEGHRRNPQEEEFLTAVANTLAGVIERHRTDLEKQRLGEQLAEVEKLSALGRIASNVADEIRNPLTSVGGFARRLLKALPEGTKEREYADFIVSEVSSLEGVLRDVLSLTRIAGPHLEGSDIHEVIEKVMKEYARTFRKRSIAVSRSFGDVPRLEIDKGQVSEALGNLLSNAVDAMPEGGTLTLVTGVEVFGKKPFAVIKIEDTGTGIPEERMAMIFEPFFTTKLSPKKKGLGLPITKRIVEDHGGFVRAESRPGSGSTFSLFFPVRPGA